jgi:hypothetical protein
MTIIFAVIFVIEYGVKMTASRLRGHDFNAGVSLVPVSDVPVSDVPVLMRTSCARRTGAFSTRRLITVELALIARRAWRS